MLVECCVEPLLLDWENGVMHPALADGLIDDQVTQVFPGDPTAEQAQVDFQRSQIEFADASSALFPK